MCRCSCSWSSPWLSDPIRPYNPIGCQGLSWIPFCTPIVRRNEHPAFCAASPPYEPFAAALINMGFSHGFTGLGFGLGLGFSGSFGLFGSHFMHHLAFAQWSVVCASAWRFLSRRVTRIRSCSANHARPLSCDSTIRGRRTPMPIAPCRLLSWLSCVTR